jgi:IS30 family transposase
MRKITRDQEATMTRLYTAGWSLRQISAALGCHRETVRRRLIRNGIELRPAYPTGVGPVRSTRHYTRGTLPSTTIIELAAKGWSIRSIARHLGASTTGVAYHIHLAGLRP